MEKRQSNFELLRIVSMLLIVIFHFSDWGGIVNITGSASNQLFGEIINIGGTLGGNLFIMISGYFLVNQKFKSKKLLKIILEVWFYSVGIAVLYSIFHTETISISRWIKSFFPISYSIYWFATIYVGLYLVFPIINKLIQNITRKKYRYILVLLGILLSVIPTILFNANAFYSHFLWFIYLYMLAAYIRKYEVISLQNNKKNILIILCILLCLLILFTIIPNIGLDVETSNLLIKKINSKNSLPLLLLAIYLFAIFKNLKIKENKIINTLAKSSFAVYLLHMNEITVNELFYKILKIQNFYDASTIVLASYVLISAILIYLICTIIDILRMKLIEQPIFKIKKFDPYFERIDNIMNI